MIFQKLNNGFVVKNKEDVSVGFIDIRSQTFHVDDNNPDAEFSLTELLEISMFMSTLRKDI